MVETEQLAHVSREAGEVLDEEDLERGRRVEGRGEELLVARAMLDAEAGDRSPPNELVSDDRTDRLELL
jgi:hypothetical protein